MPSFALAGGEGSVVLKFSASDQLYLYISLGFGVIALVAARVLAMRVKSSGEGTEKMIEVSGAIREGALAYLRRQISTMIYFVVILAIGIALLYSSQYGSMMLGIFTALSFVAGVAASYIAGYSGMLMAVDGNKRTAFAALTSYKKTLEIAFQSGAVAGLVTVGMGLIGATAIFLLAKGDAMKLLIGFGFGGSLAALFMRVGGGIFTKAADVGADLVGKVEAGIPEDDPRNPATIADNVGDNVGDCAGMAADVFESYEVTLVAAIVLGAATASIFDQTTWMKLVLFALMARGVGILASIIGIFSVKGNDDLDSDPLKSIGGGFKVSALIAAVGTIALAYFMMGPSSGGIKTSRLLDQQVYQRRAIEKIQAKRDLAVNSLTQEAQRAIPLLEKFAKDKNVAADAVPVEEFEKTEDFKSVSTDADRARAIVKFAQKVIKAKGKPVSPDQLTFEEFKVTPEFKELGLDPEKDGFMVQQALTFNADMAPKIPSYEKYSRVDWNDPDSKAAGYSVMDTSVPGQTEPKYLSMKEKYGNPTDKETGTDLYAYQVKVTRIPDAKITPGAKEETQEIWVGPIEEKTLADQITKVDPKQLKVSWYKDDPSLKKSPAYFYENAEGKLVLGIQGEGIDHPEKMSIQGMTFYGDTPENLKANDAKRKTDPSVPFAAPTSIPTTIVEQNPVEWWRFALAIIFGILMAFGIERLTDYYVSLHGRPVREVAGVSTAGPAPMIIQGFASAAESSVFLVFALVIALLFPLFLFPVAVYGTYILSFYGIALVGLGLLTTTGFILAMDTFGPISDNAQGVFEMSGAAHDSPDGGKRVQRLDAAGNTTKALTKGFAIATAVVAAVALFHSFLEDAQLQSLGLRLDLPEIFLGLMIGGAAPYLFSASTINAVGRASFQLINEVRRQFRNDPGIMAGTSKPDYGSCVAIVTKAAQTELLGPAILAIALPMAVAFGFSIGKPLTTINGAQYNLTGAQALGGFLAGAILSGQLMAVLLANSGGIWDNAKKLIEDGLYGGKGTDAHKAGVVCDTVGDPFKDTAGPALNPLIKVMNLVALLMAATIIKPMSNMVLGSVTVVCLAALAFSIWWSKRSSMLEGLSQAGVVHEEEPKPVDKRKRITVDEPAAESEGEKTE
ncbi:MAG: sodium/proton-translocating pyrophosphatase [Fimbriimonadales bacterium]